jgi:hypothetical protein
MKQGMPVDHGASMIGFGQFEGFPFADCGHSFAFE